LPSEDLKTTATDLVIFMLKEIFDFITSLALLYVGYRLTTKQQQNMYRIKRRERDIKGCSDYSDEACRLADIGEIPRMSQLGKTVI
jgi:hypothetical protein